LSHIKRLTGRYRVGTQSSADLNFTIQFDYDGFERVGLAAVTDVMRHYERFRTNSLKMHFTPVVSKTTAGSISAAPDFDPYDSAPSDSQALSVSDRFRSFPVSNPGTIDCTPYFKEWKWVAPATDLRLMSAGFFVSFTDNPDLIPVGYWTLEYDIELAIITPPRAAINVANNDRILSVRNCASNYKLPGSLTMALTDKIHIQSNNTDPTDWVIGGIIADNLIGGRLEDIRGQLIEAGTRIFYKPTTVSLNTTTPAWTITQNTADNVAQFALDPGLNDFLTFIGEGVNDVDIRLKDITYF